VKVKICGITDINTALEAAEAGADFLGLVFTTSGRQVTPEKATEIIQELRKRKKCPEVVGIFAQTKALDVQKLIILCKLDRVQLSGDEPLEEYLGLEIPMIKAIHISAETTASEVLKEIEKGYRLMPNGRLTFLLDTESKLVYGGTGRAFNWELAKEICARFPVIIAGGLNPENVGRLVSEVKPWGVDVSSGVETEGKKDILKIRKFIQEARKS